MIKQKFNVLVLVIGLALFSGQVFAATHYITPSGAGSANGLNWSNAYAGFPATLTRGDTYVVAGGNYATNPYNFDDNLSGTTYIYIRKASAALDSGITGWSSSYKSTQAVFTGYWNFSRGYYDISGVTSSSMWNSDPANYGFRVNSTAGAPIRVAAGATANNVIIRYTAITGVNNNQGINLGSGCFAANWTLQRGYFGTFKQAAKLDSYDSWTFEYNYFEHNSGQDEDPSHGETIGFVATSNHVFRYNYFNSVGRSTGGFMTLCSGGENGKYQVRNIQFYGNIFKNADADPRGGNNGLFGTADSSNGCDQKYWKIYNNTFIDCDFVMIATDSTTPSWSDGWVIKNNLFYNSRVGYTFKTPTNLTLSNNYKNNTTYGWASGTGDITSTENVAVLFVNYAGGDYHIKASSQAKDAGASLGSPYDIDANGVSRPKGAVWDIGAYEEEYVTIQPPSNLRISQ